MALRYHPRCALIDAMHHVDAEARRWQRQWVEWSEAGRIPDHRSKINNHGSWKLERICTMIALTYDCYYTTDMTLAGAGKRAHLVPGDRYRPGSGYGQTLICLPNQSQEARQDIPGTFPRWAVCCECCGRETGSSQRRGLLCRIRVPACGRGLAIPPSKASISRLDE